jgi:hypothetical protein
MKRHHLKTLQALFAHPLHPRAAHLDAQRLRNLDSGWLRRGPTRSRCRLDHIVGVVTLGEAHPSDEAMVALAREHFGNLPHRRPILVPGQATTP